MVRFNHGMENCIRDLGVDLVWEVDQFARVDRIAQVDRIVRVAQSDGYLPISLRSVLRLPQSFEMAEHLQRGWP